MKLNLPPVLSPRQVPRPARNLALLALFCITFQNSIALVVPGFVTGNTCPENHCPALAGNEHVETITVNSAGYYRFDGSGTQFVLDMKLGTSPCLSNVTEVIGTCNGLDYITCLFLNVGTYYLTIACGPACCGIWQVNVTACTVAPGESSANPIIVPSLPYNTTNNTQCHDNDSEIAGCPSGSAGNDLFYRYTPVSNNTLNITLTNTGTPPYYGLLFVNGVCYPPTNCCVNISNYAVSNGVPIDLIVDACCRLGGNYQLQITENTPPPCLQFCGLYPQDSEQCFFGYVDNYNGGCDEATFAVQGLPCGTGICAYSGNYFTGGMWRPDNDWYEFTLTQRRSVIFQINGEMRNRVRIYQRGAAGCADRVLLHDAIRDSCMLHQWSLELDPGTYWIAVYPYSPSLNVNALRYVLSTTCGPPACVTNYCSSPINVTEGVNFDSTMTSCCAADVLPQVYTNGCGSSARNSGGDLIHFVWLTQPDTLDIIASSPTLDLQIFICGFCGFDPYSSCVNSRDLLGAGLGESIIGLALPAGFYNIFTSAFGETCGAIRTQILFGPVILDSPTELVIQPQAANIRLAWDRVSGASQYHVYRDTVTTITPAPVRLIGTTSDSTYTDPGIINTANLKYFYVVTAE